MQKKSKIILVVHGVNKLKYNKKGCLPKNGSSLCFLVFHSICGKQLGHTIFSCSLQKYSRDVNSLQSEEGAKEK
jgi:hypothetical protein